MRNYRNVTKENLQQKIEESSLNTVFQTLDPNPATNILISEYNRTNNELSPAQKILLKKDNQPYYTNETREAKEEAENLLTNTIENNSPENWRIYKYCRYRYYCMVD